MRDLGAGFGYLVKGQRWVGRHGRQYGFGLVPGLITLVLYVAALGTLGVWGEDFVAWATPFADDWSSPTRGTLRVIVSVAIVLASLTIAALTYTALTLLIGDPFYERISELVEDRFGGVPGEVEVGFWRSLGRSLVDSLRLIGLSILVGVPLFVLGFLPLVGQTVVPVLGALVGGWLLAVELTGVPFQRRGKRLRHRRADLRTRRPLALGFGVAVFCCFLLPLGAILLMPAAIAGATLLARAVHGQEIEEPPARLADHQPGR